MAYIRLDHAGQAMLEAGYAPKFAAQNADEVLKCPKVAARIAELRQLAEDATIMAVLERKQRLTEVARDKQGSPIQAIDLLNKMDKIYSDTGVTNQDNRVINIYVVDERTKELMGKIADRTRKADNAPG